MDGCDLMNILLSCDDNYAPLTGVLMQSLLMNNEKYFNNFSIFILDGGISEKNKEKLKTIVNSFKISVNLEFIDYGDIEDILNIKIIATRHLSAYARLFAESLLPKNMDKILYLDVDAIVVDSLEEVYNMDITDYYIAAVEDMGPEYINNFLNLPPNTAHYNTGFLLINLKKWSEDNLEKKFIDCIVEHDGQVYHNDQGVINIVCQDKILKLDLKYNIHSPFFEVGYDNILKFYGVSQYYTEEIGENAIKHPVFIHFVQFVYGRPWFTNAKNHPLRELFDFYVNQTPFADEIYTKDNRGFAGKFLSFSYKIFPFSFVCWMFTMYRNLLVKRNFGG